MVHSGGFYYSSFMLPLCRFLGGQVEGQGQCGPPHYGTPLIRVQLLHLHGTAKHLTMFGDPGKKIADSLDRIKLKWKPDLTKLYWYNLPQFNKFPTDYVKIINKNKFDYWPLPMKALTSTLHLIFYMAIYNFSCILDFTKNGQGSNCG